MDIRTGKTYETQEAALADGVPASDIAHVTVTRDGEYWPKFDNPKRYTGGAQQGARELARRANRLAERAV
jgi:hypothetical protein